ncbi:MAG: hypothetical protein ACPGQD_04380 [Planctomycetota bacterium]
MAGGRPKGRKFGWSKLRKMLDPRRVRRDLKKNLRRAHHRVGQKFVQMVKDKLSSSEGIVGNAPLTIALKGSSKPLINHGDLFGSVTYNVPRFHTLRIGVSSRMLPSGRTLAEVLHNGATIPVTTAMRRAVAARLRERGNVVLPSVGGKQFWHIPARPFLRDVFESSEFIEFAQRQYEAAVAKTMAVT